MAASAAPGLHAITLPTAKGSGSFGCISEKFVPCGGTVGKRLAHLSDADVSRANTVVKFQVASIAERVWARLDTLREVDPDGAFLLPIKGMCAVTDPVIVERLRAACPPLQRGVSHDDLPMQLFMDKGLPFMSPEFMKLDKFGLFPVMALFTQLMGDVAKLEAAEILHGDIKLENIMLLNGKLHLIDFDFLTAFDLQSPMVLRAHRPKQYASWRDALAFDIEPATPDIRVPKPAHAVLRAFHANGQGVTNNLDYFPPESAWLRACIACVEGVPPARAMFELDAQLQYTQWLLASETPPALASQVSFLRTNALMTFATYWTAEQEKYSLGSHGAKEFQPLLALCESYAPDKHAAYQMGHTLLRVLALCYKCEKLDAMPAGFRAMALSAYTPWICIVNSLLTPEPTKRWTCARAFDEMLAELK